MTYLLFAALLVAVLMVAIPKDVRHLLSENSRNRHGEIKLKYLFRELGAVANFYSGILFYAVMLVFLVIFALMMVDSYVIPTGLITKAIDQAESDPGMWKENLTTGFDNVKGDYEQWHIAQGGTKASARPWMQFLWVSVPFAVVGSFGVIIVGLRLTSTSYRRALNELVGKASERNLHRVRRRYLSENRRRRPSEEEWSHVNAD